jgi:3-deoxy-7-phosphoheptulonate synthase
MIIVLKPGATQAEIDHVIEKIRPRAAGTHLSAASSARSSAPSATRRRCANAAGDPPGVDQGRCRSRKPYKMVAREFKPNRRDRRRRRALRRQAPAVIAGPCAVEGAKMLLETARKVKAAGATALRGGAFKPRTSPYAFQGLEGEGLRYLAEAREATGLLVCTEIMDPRDLELVDRYADFIQVGARNMSNFRLLKELGTVRKPIILKRGLSATVKDLLLSAEYIVASAANVIL